MLSGRTRYNTQSLWFLSCALLKNTKAIVNYNNTKQNKTKQTRNTQHATRNTQHTTHNTQLVAILIVPNTLETPRNNWLTNLLTNLFLYIVLILSLCKALEKFKNLKIVQVDL
jgi:uncharacterized membrane protein SirB2